MDEIWGKIGNHFTKGKPSVVSNVLTGKPWNQNTQWGIQSPLPHDTKIGKMPKVPDLKMPKQVTPTPQPMRKVAVPIPTKIIKKPKIRQVEAAMITPTPMPDMSEMERRTYETFNNYRVPHEVAYGIAGGENGKINKFNLGAVDSNPGNAVKFPSVEAEATAAARFLSGRADASFYGNGEAGKKAFREAWKKRHNPEEYLAAIRDAGYAGDPKTWKKRSIEQSAAIGQKGAGLYYDTWDEFIKNTPAYKKWKKKDK